MMMIRLERVETMTLLWMLGPLFLLFTPIRTDALVTIIAAFLQTTLICYYGIEIWQYLKMWQKQSLQTCEH